MKKFFLLSISVMSLSGFVAAAEFKGYIIDEKCSANPKMRGDAACAEKCIKGGSPAVLVTDDGKVYKIADQAKVIPLAGKQVTISGDEKGGNIMIASIK